MLLSMDTPHSSKQGLPAAAWFAGQSFHNFSAAPASEHGQTTHHTATAVAPVHAFDAAQQLCADARADREQFPDPLAHIRVKLEREVAAERDDDPLTYRYLAEPCALCRGTRKGGDGYPCDGCEGTGLKECRAYGRHRPTVDFPLGAPRGRVLPTYEQAIALLRDWAADDGLDALPHGNGAVLREQLMLIAHALELRSEADGCRAARDAEQLDLLAGECATLRVELQGAEAELAATADRLAELVQRVSDKPAATERAS